MYFIAIDLIFDFKRRISILKFNYTFDLYILKEHIGCYLIPRRIYFISLVINNVDKITIRKI